MADDAAAPPDPTPRFGPLFAAALAVRLGVVLLGIAIAASRPDSGPQVEPSKSQYAELDARAAWPFEPWYRADALWVLQIAKHGYANAAGPGGQHGAAFLPALPGVMALAALLGLNVYWVGVLVPCVAAAAGVAVLCRLAVRLTGDRGAALRTFVVVNCFPSALFLSAPYQEAFGLLFTALALWYWQAGKAARSGAAAGLGCLARLTGATVGAAAVGAWVLERPRTRTGLRRAVIVAAGCTLGVLAGWAVLWVAVGNPFLGMKSQAGWGRRGASPVNFVYAIRSIWEHPLYVEGALAILFAVLGVRAWRKRGAFWGLVTLLPVAQMMATGTFLSAHRLLLAALPGFVELADLLRNRLALMTAATLSAVLQFKLLDAYVHWGFAG